LNALSLTHTTDHGLTRTYSSQPVADFWHPQARLRQAMNQVDHIEPTGQEQFPL